MKIYEKLQQQYQNKGNVQNLMKLFDVKELTDKCHSLKNKAPGIDGLTKYEYGKQLDDNINVLYRRIKDGTYTPKNIKRCYIPKSNGKLRPIGISAFEDRIVQGIMADVLYSIYDPMFLDYSYGYRLNRNCHSALSALKLNIGSGKTHYLVKSDIKGFFDNISHKAILDLLEPVIRDRHFRKYVKRFLQTGIYVNGRLFPNITGTPQGGLISPILANIYLHYALDKWFYTEINNSYNDSNLIRYCDDFIASFTTKSDATHFITAAQKRLKEYQLELEPDKTKLIKFNINDTTSEVFNFLGFNISVDMFNHIVFRASHHKLMQKVSDISNKVLSSLEKGCSTIDCLRSVNHSLTGLYNFYCVSSNSLWLNELYSTTCNVLKDILCVNSSTSQMSLEQYHLLLEFIPIVTPPSHLIEL